MFIEFETFENGVMQIEISPQVTLETYGRLFEFPEIKLDEYTPIYHSIKLVYPLDLIESEYSLTEEVEKQIKAKYYVEDNQIIIASLDITEFPDDWKEEMETSWFNWLDVLDGDHAIIGARADQIVDEDVYDEHFDFGSLYYIRRLDVHPNFRGEEIGRKLINHTFKYLLRNAQGIVFLIAKPMQSKLSESQLDFNSSSRLSRYYNRCGFKRVTKERSESILMEVQVHKMKI
ncbi:GNAT family N-acetyltransferase [Paenibacillus sp. 276b]|uniref:GNAT family N-acetyltransferase n=1 Tax=Paenibacillus sp. 276b TaxID=1566277 RepID=UPI00089A040D|nr:GNAT family N-acetyltransferase [Paenibacillus sp. 276b]SEB10615.1 Acetyltransferase (GNAT) domain-containing protein [Paenibacillus sp. 276b]